MKEIKSLVPRDGELAAELRLDRMVYDRTKAEIGHHYGQPLISSPINNEIGQPIGEHFKLAGLWISTIDEPGDA